MEEKEELIDTETSVRHIDIKNCQCSECNKNRKRYIQVIDVDRYVNALNDWD